MRQVFGNFGSILGEDIMVIKRINEKRIFRILFIFLTIFMILYVVKKENIYSEPDSYVLPIISIQYGGGYCDYPGGY